MKKEQLAVNTLVFLEDLRHAVRQDQLLDTIHSLGINTVEIRREFITDFQMESSLIREKSMQYAMTLFYSVSGVLYTNGKPDFDTLETYLKEAVQIGATQLKLCIGDYINVVPSDVALVNRLCSIYQIRLTIENDQTNENGHMKKIKQFLDEYTALGGQIFCTYDIGNWLWQNEDPYENAESLKKYVAYIHLKDVKGGNELRTVYLDDGDIDWRNILRILPPVPIAFEYSCGVMAAKQLPQEVWKVLNQYS